VINGEFMSKIRPLAGLASMRVGSQFDGGYVVPIKVLEESKLLVSFGYGNNYEFEKEFLEFASSNRCKLFDGSIDSKKLLIHFLKYLVLQSPRTGSFPRYHLLNLLRFLRLRMTPRLFYYPKFVSIGASNLPNSIDARQAFEKELGRSGVILKMDIEGDEYLILEYIMDVCNHFSCLIVEFHDVDKQIDWFLGIISKLKENFFISNIHFNNYTQLEGSVPKTVEVVFAHKIYQSNSLVPANKIPSYLDNPNTPSKPEIHYIYS
jgi:hypothetical protein